jgi:hypothetical protein
VAGGDELRGSEVQRRLQRNCPHRLAEVSLTRTADRSQACFTFRTVFWDVLPCKMIVDRRFRGASCLHYTAVHPRRQF